MLLILLSNPFVVNLALQKLETPPTLKSDLPLVNTAVVLGGMVMIREYTEQIQLNASAERIEEAITLYHEGLINQIILSGGSGSLLHQEFSESKQLKGFIIERGVKERDLIIEPNSQNTYQNAAETRKILDSLLLSNEPILLITSSFHMKRAMRCFQKQGIKFIPYPVDFISNDLDWSADWIIPNAEAITTWQLILKELIGTLTYRITGYA